jgi:hypothetical protein
MATTKNRTRKLSPCAVIGCNCMQNVMLHNMNAINRMKQRQANAPRSSCPKCGEGGNAAVIGALGRCFACKKAEDGVKYDIESWTKR